ncbi:phosphatase PAP2 family protein [Suttonella ornithocola]|uniref:undecaprenyl-diphosphate phosphatase n=1 Tax=Suttonella ornithocola TaxID=279832 RepID=A0A380MZU4_9GAMM|nr:phosphatase PAP2 family protein [Suttonella ornithocola]SUO97201.1 Phosphatidylglycerophosphatase B [Suttonella ornithocola]
MHLNIRLISTAFLLLLIPFAFYLSGWYWKNDSEFSYTILIILYFITETGSIPTAVIISFLLTFCLWRKLGKHHTWLILALSIISMTTTQITKSLLKNHFAEPRPYIAAMHQYDKTAIKKFYMSNKTQQQQEVATYYLHFDHKIPHLLTQHRIKEVAYRFPSGHTIFVASWAFLFIALLPRKKISYFVIIWAALVMASRVLLGMHTPSDLAASVLLALLINWLLLWGFFSIIQSKNNFNLHYQ